PTAEADDFKHEEEAVFRVIRVFGLWGGPDDAAVEAEPNPVAKAQLRGIQVAQRLARECVDRWTDEASGGRPADRRRARAPLSRVGPSMVLIPERGGRDAKVSPFVLS